MMPHADDSSASADAPLRQIDPTTRVQVYFQGILDDACFLYAQANAYKALTGKRVTPEHWNWAVSRLREPAAFLGGPGATQLSYDEAVRHIEGVLEAFSDPGETFTLDKLSPSAGIADFATRFPPTAWWCSRTGGKRSFRIRRRMWCAASR